MSVRSKKSGFESLRIACRKKMITLGYDRTGSIFQLAQKMGVNYQALSMALTGYRDTPRSIEILMQLRVMLDAEKKGGDRQAELTKERQANNTRQLGRGQHLCSLPPTRGER